MNIHDMTVMRETRLIVVSTWEGSLFQLSLQEGHFIEKEIKRPCEHGVPVYLLCVQVEGSEYLALSCEWCETIKLMNLNKQKRSSSESRLMQYKVITALSGEKVSRMCHGEKNRLFVLLLNDVLELDTSTTPFKKVNIGSTCSRLPYQICYGLVTYLIHTDSLLSVMRMKFVPCPVMTRRKSGG